MFALILAKILCFKNRILNIANNRKEIMIYLILIIFPIIIFVGSKQIFKELINNPRFDLIILSKITSTLLLALNSVAIIASIISSIGNLHTAKDLSLLSTLPISKSQIFFSKFVSIIIESSWTIFLFLLPILFSIGSIFNMPISYYTTCILSVLALATSSSAIGVIISSLAINKLGPKACLEIIVILMSVILVYVMIFTNSPNVGNDKNSIQEIISFFAKNDNEISTPHILASSSIASYWDSTLSFVNFWYLNLAALALIIIANFCYSHIKFTDHKLASKKMTSAAKIYRPLLRSKKQIIQGRLIAFASKENKTIMRDLSQASQFVILIFITFVYLLNFQQLKNKPNLDANSVELWHSLLAISNISLGSCVLTAIATRFIFPSISLEGKCFELLKSAPLRMYDIVFYKFTTWLIPFTCIAVIILLAGSFAIDANIHTIIITAFIAINMSFALVATAIGTGAKYARFDWDSPTQIATGFGSLILMLKSFIVVTIYTVLASIPISISCVSNVNNNITVCLLIASLTIFVSTIFVRDNLNSGALALQEQR